MMMMSLDWLEETVNNIRYLFTGDLFCFLVSKISLLKPALVMRQSQKPMGSQRVRQLKFIVTHPTNVYDSMVCIGMFDPRKSF